MGRIPLAYQVDRDITSLYGATHVGDELLDFVGFFITSRLKINSFSSASLGIGIFGFYKMIQQEVPTSQGNPG